MSADKSSAAAAHPATKLKLCAVGCQVLDGDRFMFSIAPRNVAGDQHEGESWLDMRNRTQPARIAAESEAQELAAFFAAAPAWMAEAQQLRKRHDELLRAAGAQDAQPLPYEQVRTMALAIHSRTNEAGFSQLDRIEMGIRQGERAHGVDTGCGACGDACKSRGGACQLAEDSPPIGGGAQDAAAINAQMLEALRVALGALEQTESQFGSQSYEGESKAIKAVCAAIAAAEGK